MKDEHDKAEKRKNKRMEKIHTERTKKRNKREFKLKKLEHLDKSQKLRHIIKSLQPLDYYPNDFLDIDQNTIYHMHYYVYIKRIILKEESIYSIYF